MPHSFSQTASLTCPQCGRAFSAEVWLIVDADERPDLAERIRAGTLHDVTCPHCGHQGQVDAPLLLLRPGATPPLLFSPAQETTPEEDRQQAAGLVGLLQERMGPAWRDEWLAQGLPGVPRPLLPAAMSDDPEAALRQLAEQAAREIERLRAEDPEAYRQLEEAARQAMQPPHAADVQTLQGEPSSRPAPGTRSRRILEAHPELLSDEADALLGQLVQAAQAQGDENARRLRSPRPPAAAAGRHPGRHLGRVPAASWRPTPNCSLDEADALLGQLLQAAQAQGDENARRILEEHRCPPAPLPGDRGGTGVRGPPCFLPSPAGRERGRG
jgi:hypothetical protein